LATGRILVAVDPIQPADAIYVLDGNYLDRAAEAADLYRAGFAPRIVLSRGGLESSERFFEAEGVHIPTHAELLRDILVTRLGLPASGIEALSEPVASTAEEARAIAPRAKAGRWSRLIVITDRSSTRRAGIVFRRVLGPQVTVIAWCSQRDRYDPSQWWKSRAMLRPTFYEVPKLLACWLGLAG
jgi:uncharacterized SAM-binding protein YcdF (DUF218 family)